MQFLYVFLLMFLSIFGLAVLLRAAARFLFSAECERRDVYVVCGESLSAVVEKIRESPRVGRVVIVAAENVREARALAEKYSDIELAELSELQPQAAVSSESREKGRA